MVYEYHPQGVCSRVIQLDMDGTIIRHAQFIGGCDGNLKGICSLIQDQEATEVIRRLRGIHCGKKPTSCPDQLAQMLEAVLEQQKAQQE